MRPQTSTILRETEITLFSLVKARLSYFRLGEHWRVNALSEHFVIVI